MSVFMCVVGGMCNVGGGDISVVGVCVCGLCGCGDNGVVVVCCRANNGVVMHMWMAHIVV